MIYNAILLAMYNVLVIGACTLIIGCNGCGKPSTCRGGEQVVVSRDALQVSGLVALEIHKRCAGKQPGARDVFDIAMELLSDHPPTVNACDVRDTLIPEIEKLVGAWCAGQHDIGVDLGRSGGKDGHHKV